MQEVRVALIRLDPELPLPEYAHAGDAGADLYSAEDLTLDPGARRLVRTGVAVALPEGYGGFVHPRSGLAARHGVTVLNAPGTVDAGYRGEILVCLYNTDATEPVRINRGDRIAQLVVQPVSRAAFVVATALPPSTRGSGGHGSTGGIGSTAVGADSASSANRPSSDRRVPDQRADEGDQSVHGETT